MIPALTLAVVFWQGADFVPRTLGGAFVFGEPQLFVQGAISRAYTDTASAIGSVFESHDSVEPAVSTNSRRVARTTPESWIEWETLRRPIALRRDSVSAPASQKTTSSVVSFRLFEVSGQRSSGET
jgi:hypothetical protein